MRDALLSLPNQPLPGREPAHQERQISPVYPGLPLQLWRLLAHLWEAGVSTEFTVGSGCRPHRLGLSHSLLRQTRCRRLESSQQTTGLVSGWALGAAARV